MLRVQPISHLSDPLAEALLRERADFPELDGRIYCLAEEVVRLARVRGLRAGQASGADTSGSPPAPGSAPAPGSS